ASKAGDFSSCYTAHTHPATPAVPPIRNDRPGTARVEQRETLSFRTRRNRGGGRAVGAVEHGEESPDDRNVLASKGGDFSSRYTAHTHPASPAVAPIRNDRPAPHE